jgi:hypothetical protein
MNICIHKTRPTTKPIREYETRILSIGFRYRYDTHTNMLSSIEKHPDGIIYHEEPCSTTVFSRGYHSELVRVIVYSDSPKIWCEETSVDDYFVFAQQPTQAA